MPCCSSPSTARMLEDASIRRRRRCGSRAGRRQGRGAGGRRQMRGAAGPEAGALCSAPTSLLPLPGGEASMAG
jgi:hypothetical protein